MFSLLPTVLILVGAFLVGALVMARFSNTKFGQFVAKIVGGVKKTAPVPSHTINLAAASKPTTKTPPASGASAKKASATPTTPKKK